MNIFATKANFFWYHSQDIQEVSCEKHGPLIGKPIAGLPIKSLVFGWKQVELMSWLRILE